MSVSPLKYISMMKYHLRYVPDIFKEYSKVFTWPKHENFRIVDIGSGPGHLVDKLETFFPRHYAEVVCVDKEIDMVNYFNSVSKDPKISARQLDIETMTIPADLREHFDFAFSCYCFQYVKDVGKAFKNSSQLLKANGESLFIWCQRCHMYDIYNSLSKVQKWSTYTNDFKYWKNYFDIENPLSMVEMEFNKVGMKILRSEKIDECCFEDETFQCFLDLLDSLDTISTRIPKDDLSKYREDFHKVLISELIVDENAGSGLKYKLPFPTLVVAAKKY